MLMGTHQARYGIFGDEATYIAAVLMFTRGPGRGSTEPLTEPGRFADEVGQQSQVNLHVWHKSKKRTTGLGVYKQTCNWGYRRSYDILMFWSSDF